jgi:hypothetical protein
MDRYNPAGSSSLPYQTPTNQRQQQFQSLAPTGATGATGEGARPKTTAREGNIPRAQNNTLPAMNKLLSQRTIIPTKRLIELLYSNRGKAMLHVGARYDYEFKQLLTSFMPATIGTTHNQVVFFPHQGAVYLYEWLESFTDIIEKSSTNTTIEFKAQIIVLIQSMHGLYRADKITPARCRQIQNILANFHKTKNNFRNQQAVAQIYLKTFNDLIDVINTYEILDRASEQGDDRKQFTEQFAKHAKYIKTMEVIIEYAGNLYQNDIGMQAVSKELEVILQLRKNLEKAGYEIFYDRLNEDNFCELNTVADENLLDLKAMIQQLYEKLAQNPCPTTKALENLREKLQLECNMLRSSYNAFLKTNHHQETSIVATDARWVVESECMLKDIKNDAVLLFDEEFLKHYKVL